MLFLAITVALIALLIPFITRLGISKASTGQDDYSVDLGYQLNRGQAVSVSLMDHELFTARSMCLLGAADRSLLRLS